jgi:drug/metabolite transporter (DMT)-like permease
LLAQLGLVYCAAIWGSTFIVVKAATAIMSPLTLVAWRFLLTAALLAVWLALARRPFWSGLRQGLALGAMLAVLYVAQTVGLVYTTASNSGFITGLFIVFVPLVGLLLYRERPLPRHLAAVAIALGGLWLLTGGVHGANRGDWLTLLCAITYAGHVVYAGRCMARGADPLTLNFQQVLVTGLAALFLAVPARAPLAITDPRAWAIIVFLAVFPTLSAFHLQLVGQRYVDSTRTSLIFTLEPVFAAVFAWTLGGEQPLPIKAVGGALIVVAMLVSELSYPPADRAAIRSPARREP